MLKPSEVIVPELSDIRRAALRYHIIPMSELNVYFLENNKGKYNGVFILCFRDGGTWEVVMDSKVIEDEKKNAKGWRSRSFIIQKMTNEKKALWMTVKKGL